MGNFLDMSEEFEWSPRADIYNWHSFAHNLLYFLVGAWDLFFFSLKDCAGKVVFFLLWDIYLCNLEIG